MTRLAIVIGVGENRPPLTSLSACVNDAEAVAAILQETKRFDQILKLVKREDVTSERVKEQITRLVESNRNSSIEEIVFYFSGHGDFSSNEFYHVLSDYDSSARNRTSLANSELDAMMRGLSPKLFVKIVDACHSGTNYIKNGEEFGEFLKGSKNSFNDVYFLYSSQSDQVSWTSGDLSAFTKSILLEVGRRDAGLVRYRDLMNAASDYFETAGGQTPQFVTQADFTQVFCDASATMQETVGKFLPASVTLAPADPLVPIEGKNLSLIDRIKKAENLFCSHEEATSILDIIPGLLEAEKLPAEIKDIYSAKVTLSKEAPTGNLAVGDWLNKNPERGFFAHPEYKTVNYKKRVLKSNISFLNKISLLGHFENLSDDDYKLVDATRQDVSGYRNSTSIPYEMVEIRLSSEFRSVAPLACQVIPIVSPYDVRLFWTIQEFVRSDWDSFTPSKGSSKWRSDEVSLKDTASLRETCHQIFGSLSEAAENLLKTKWPDLGGVVE